MNVSLTPELEKLVAEKVQSGMYQTSSEVVREGLRLLKERDEHLATLRREIRAGFEEIERGAFTKYDAANVHTLAEGVHERGLKRLATKSPNANPR